MHKYKKKAVKGMDANFRIPKMVYKSKDFLLSEKKFWDRENLKDKNLNKKLIEWKFSIQCVIHIKIPK